MRKNTNFRDVASTVDTTCKRPPLREPKLCRYYKSESENRIVLAQVLSAEYLRLCGTDCTVGPSKVLRKVPELGLKTGADRLHSCLLQLF